MPQILVASHLKKTRLTKNQDKTGQLQFSTTHAKVNNGSKDLNIFF